MLGRPRSPMAQPSQEPMAQLRRAGQPLLKIFDLVRRVVSPIVGRPIHPHALRHSFASRLREHGADLQIMHEALGHASIGTTVMYAHLAPGPAGKSLERLPMSSGHAPTRSAPLPHLGRDGPDRRGGEGIGGAHEPRCRRLHSRYGIPLKSVSFRRKALAQTGCPWRAAPLCPGPSRR